MLAEYEQKVVLQQILNEKKYAEIAKWSTRFVITPVPSWERKSERYSKDNPAFYTYVPPTFTAFIKEKYNREADFSKFDDRWAWVEGSLWPEFELYLNNYSSPYSAIQHLGE
jgi:hypothetical protein